MGKPWTSKEVTTLIRMRGENASSIGIARALKRSRQSVENKAKQLISENKIQPIPKAEQYLSGLDSRMPDLNKFYELEGDFLSVSDVHVPFHNGDLLRRLMQVAKKFGMKRLIINGDFLNGDAFTHYCTPNRGRDSSEAEFEAAERVLQALLSVFREIYLTMGNHEMRIFKALQGQVNPTRFMLMIRTEQGKRIHVSDYPYCIVHSGGERYLVGHPENFGSRGGQVPADLADKYQMNVILGHNHQFGVQMSLSGRYMGIDQGMGADGNKVEYYMKGLNKYRTWQNGFTMVRNGKPYVFNLNFTDWNWWLK